MHGKNTSTAVNGKATGNNKASNQAPFFQPFEWVVRGNQGQHYELLSNARDISDGVAAVLQMIEQDSLLRADDEQRMFNDNVAGRLMRLSIASLETLRAGIDKHFDWLNDHPAQGGEK